MTIERFRGEHFYLSNMYPLKVPILALCGIQVPTSEHVYMSGRFVDPDVQREVAEIRAEPSDASWYANGKAVKSFARKLVDSGEEQLPDWPNAKLDLMYEAVKRKFAANHDIALLLAQTGVEELVEGNDWGDRFWGVDPIGSTDGENHLGLILMRVRNELSGIYA
ncbi:MAG: NADAR family protein [Candidatus Saccharimonadales bacterium]